MCAWCSQLLLHSEKEKLESVFLVACSWLQTPTPVLPMIRKSAMWNLPNPMVSTASSTVNVFCPVTPTGKKETKQNRISRQVVPPQVFMKYERLMWTVPVERLETPNLPWHGCCEPRLGTVLSPSPTIVTAAATGTAGALGLILSPKAFFLIFFPHFKNKASSSRHELGWLYKQSLQEAFSACIHLSSYLGKVRAVQIFLSGHLSSSLVRSNPEMEQNFRRKKYNNRNQGRQLFHCCWWKARLAAMLGEEQYEAGPCGCMCRDCT